MFLTLEEGDGEEPLGVFRLSDNAQQLIRVDIHDCGDKKATDLESTVDDKFRNTVDEYDRNGENFQKKAPG